MYFTPPTDHPGNQPSTINHVNRDIVCLAISPDDSNLMQHSGLKFSEDTKTTLNLADDIAPVQCRSTQGLDEYRDSNKRMAGYMSAKSTTMTC